MRFATNTDSGHAPVFGPVKPVVMLLDGAIAAMRKR